ncbi:formate--tetrahydrofolate ligase [Micrococcus terreus]|uniref:formate--tetrahydrofolate ligase n=1 Tax=Micrococcus terreus TaxID=574650 RepID=UPI0023F70D90|nr:formate--tetrahydrofolate ligase [Micrococcus terreus]
MTPALTDAQISAAATLKPIAVVGKDAGIPDEALIPYGRSMAKVEVRALPQQAGRNGRVVLVTGISPTPAGEGKTTVTVGLVDGMNVLAGREDAPEQVAGSVTMAALREPSLGPVFGKKGGATGGGYAQVAPMEQINLHFTGDFHAITSAHNLLCALIDNHIHQGNELGIDPRTITVKRALDVNDRSLRHTVIGLGGKAQGVPRENGFEITVATETMAVFCLARDLTDLKERLGRITVGQTFGGEPVSAGQIGPNGAQGAMAVLLKDALNPNLVQTLGGSAALVHGGPFANIAHGCNSVMATRTAQRLADWVVTEAGFGADLGGEKFMDITAPAGGFEPAVSVVVATVRALKLQGGMTLAEVQAGADAAVAAGDAGAAERHLQALEAGVVNLQRHVENMRRFGVPVVVAVNRFGQDTDAELAWLRGWCEHHEIPVAVADVWAQGGKGAVELARRVVEVVEQAEAVRAEAEARMADAAALLTTEDPHEVPGWAPLYPADLPVAHKIETIVEQIYRGARVEYAPLARRQLAELEAAGLDRLPVCMAKTPYSFSDDPSVLGAPQGFTVTVREVVARTGAGFVVVLTGNVMTMPGLPASPAADQMDVGVDGTVTGLF